MNFDYNSARLMAQSMRIAWKIGDEKRDAGLQDRPDVESVRNIVYGPYGLFNALDIFYPKDRDKTADLPVIVNIHGGGWQYGDKELYRFYNQSLASRGFAVIGFNYRLAPEDAWPANLIDVNRVMTWLSANAPAFHLDTDRLFILGDSAGGQMAFWYTVLLTSPAYRALYEKAFPLKASSADTHRETLPFTIGAYKMSGVPADMLDIIPEANMLPDDQYRFTVPADKLHIRACALNCGIYDMVAALNSGKDVAFTNALGEFPLLSPEHKAVTSSLIDSWSHVTAAFPPAYILSATHDFLRPMAQPLCDYLHEKGVTAECHIWGREEDEYMCHVFHVNQKLQEAAEANDAECAFFRKYLN